MGAAQDTNLTIHKAMMPIKTAFLLSYDHEMLKRSLPLVYKASDMIVLSTDIDRRTYTGNTYHIPDAFFEWVKEIDVDQKIRIHEDRFYVPDVRPMVSEVRQRNMIAELMGPGGWHVQIDADEYFVDFEAFVRQLRRFEQRLEPGEKVTVHANWISLFKQVEAGYLVALCRHGYETFWPATNHPKYTTGRISAGNKALFTDHFVIHETLARGREDLVMKLNNWSHSADFDREAYLRRYDAIDGANYADQRNVHWRTPEVWSRLALIPAQDMDGVVEYVRSRLESRIRAWCTDLRNRRGGGRLLELFRYLAWR